MSINEAYEVLRYRGTPGIYADHLRRVGDGIDEIASLQEALEQIRKYGR